MDSASDNTIIELFKLALQLTEMSIEHDTAPDVGTTFSQHIDTLQKKYTALSAVVE